MPAISVLLPLPIGPLTYWAPDGDPTAGRAVVVPFQGRLRVGVALGSAAPREAQAALIYLGEAPWLGQPELDFILAVAEELFCPPGLVFQEFFPYFEPTLEHKVRLSCDSGAFTPAEVWDPEVLASLRQAGLLAEQIGEHRPKGKLILADLGAAHGSEEQTVVERLTALGFAESQAELTRATGVKPRVIKQMLAAGILTYGEPPEPPPGPAPALEPWPVDDAELVAGGRFRDRMRVLAAWLEQGENLVIFPEAALLRRAQAFFPQIPSFSGELSPNQRRQRLRLGLAGNWFATYQGLALPFRPQRIILVEENSAGYKLLGKTRAHLPGLVRLRAELLGVPQLGLDMVPPVGDSRPVHWLPLPQPRLYPVDLKEAKGFPFAGVTIRTIRQALEKGHQVLVLASRNNYARSLRCQNCQYLAACPNCALPLALHNPGKNAELRCHQCGYRARAPLVCPACQSELLTLKGPGLEWLAECLQREFPELAVVTHSRAAPADFSLFSAGRSGILVSTSAILRAPPLPELALIVIPLLEGFTTQSFRSHEELHALLWQLSDLHPRRRPLLLVQTYDPAHPALAALAACDPVSFLTQEAAQRQKYRYPPAWRWAKLEYSHPRQGVLRTAMAQLGAWLANQFDAQSYLGPAPAPVEKIKGTYIEHLILRGQSTHDLAAMLAALPRLARVRTRIDPDPWEFFGLEE